MKRFRELEHFILPLAFIGLLVAAFAPRERVYFELEAPRTADARLTFGGATTVAQTVRLPLQNLARIDIPLELPSRSEAYPLIVHLKASVTDREDLRTLYVTEREVPEKTNIITFRFLPPFDADDVQELAIVLDAPRAENGEFAAYREIDASKYEEGQLVRGQRQLDGNIALQLHLRRPFIRFLLSDAKRALVPDGMGTLNDGETVRALLARLRFGILGLALGVIAFTALRSRKISAWLSGDDSHSARSDLVVLLLFAILSLLLHIPYIRSYPVVNDEGAYLMDLANLRTGAVPFRDFLTKGPLFLTILSPFVLTGAPSLMTARVLIAIAASLNVVLIGMLARRLWGRIAGIAAGFLWAVTPVVIAQSSQVFLQPIELLFVSSAFLLLFRDPKRASGPKRAFLVGIVLGLAYFTRSSAIAFLLAAITLVLFGAGPRRIRSAASVCAGFFLVIATISLIALPILGLPKTAVLLNLEAFLVSQGRAETGFAFSPRSLFGDSPWDVVERTLNVGTSVIRGGYPILLFWFLITLRILLRALKLPSLFLIPLAGGMLLWIWQPLSDILLRSVPMPLGWLFVGSAALLAVFALEVATRNTYLPLRPRRDLILLGGTWIVLALMYAALGRFRQHYHPEFLFVYVLGGGLFCAHLLHSPFYQWNGERVSLKLLAARVFTWKNGGFPAAATLVLTMFLLVFSHEITLTRPHAGNIPLRSAAAIAHAVRLHSEPQEEIFTANALIPFLAERRIPFAMSHPGWYLEERAGTIPSSLRQLYFPDRDVLRAYIREKPVNVVVLDRRTEEVYFSPDPELEQMLRSAFRRVQSFHIHGERPLEIWKRVQ